MNQITIKCKGYDNLNVLKKKGGKGNYSSSIHSSFGNTFHQPLARDLFRIGQAVFIADRAFRRRTKLGRQTRQLTIRVPVEESDKWKALADDTAALANFVSQDHWKFEFVELKNESQDHSTSQTNRLNLTNPSVNLFSDGLDSLCGAVTSLKNGETPVFVSHSPPGYQSVKKKITELKDKLGVTTIDTQYVNFRFTLSDKDSHGKRNMFPERTRRTRPFLYLSMAGAVALELKIPRINLNENGVLAINLPVRSHISGPQISRHAHPETLRLFEVLFQKLWNQQFASPSDQQKVEVNNPFIDKTKGEELEVLRSCENLAKETTSCEYSRQQVALLRSWSPANGKPFKKARECGLCYPCLVRRTAMKNASIQEDDEHYAFDACATFKGKAKYSDKTPLYSIVADNVKDLYQFCEKIKGMDVRGFVSLYMPELSLLPFQMNTITKEVTDVFEIYQRFADQFIENIC